MPLLANDDTANVTEDAVVNTAIGSVFTNDTGGTGPLTVTQVNSNANNVGQTLAGIYGSIRINADGSYTYTLSNSDPDTQALRVGQIGIDSFTYTAFDGTTSSTATIRVNVAGFNDAPSANNDSKSVQAGPTDVVATGNVITNDFDRETEATLVVTEVNGSAGNVGNTITGTYGTLTLNANGSYTYTLDVDDPDTQALKYYSAAPEVFTYTISDGDGGTDTATLTISVGGVDRPDTYEVTAETVVNSTTAGTQDFSASAALASGGYVVTWLDSGTPGNAEIRGQLYDGNGAKTGAEFLVNSADSVSQLAPEIVALEGGGFVAVWALQGGGIEAQVFSDAGAKLGGKIVVASGAAEITPDVGALSNGGFVISWQGQISGNDEVKAQMYDATGATVGSQILVPASPVAIPLIVGLEGGGFVVAMASGWGQIYDDDGIKVGGQFRVVTDQIGQRGPSHLNAIAALAGGGFVTTNTWSIAASQQYDPSTVTGQVYDANGAKVGDEFRIPETATSGTSQEGDSTIIALADGRFVVTWYSGSIRAMIIDAQGNLAGREFVVSDTAGTDTNGAGVALASGDIAFTWTNASDIATQLFAVLDGDPSHLGTTGDDTIRADLGTTGTFAGMAGNDTYFVDQQSDRVIERVGEGYDTVYSSVSYALFAGSEVEVLSTNSWGGTAAIALTGNGFNNVIFGNAGDNVLNGGGGADSLTGFGGHDVYFLDNAADTVAEANGGGFDTIYTSVSYTLGAGVHAEILSTANWSGTEALNLTGNELDNRLYGNAGANVLTGGNGADWLSGMGGGGADTLVGGAGDDIYWIYAGSDAITETGGNGYDTAYLFTSYALGADANVEVVSTFNWLGTEAINLSGNGLANSIFGNAGVNTLNGGGGADYLAGFGGADSFAFTTALGGGNVDTIADFVAGTDKVALDDAIFTGIGGTLNANAFVIGSAAADADDRIIYNSATGQLFYDADGNGAGAAVQFASLSTGLALTASDFQMI